MTSSRALLVVENNCHGTRVARAAASAPQRWAIARRSADGWLEATHQLLGDGVFGGDAHRARIVAGARCRVSVRAVAATPLRSPDPSATLTHLRAEGDSRLLHLPGALIPHLGAKHSNVLKIDATGEACVLAVSVLSPGRSGMAERNVFCQLRQRTVVRVGGVLVFAEDFTVDPGRFAIDGPAGFATDGAVVSAIAIGPWGPGQADWWRQWRETDGATGGAGSLRSGGVGIRALCGNLGTATSLVASIEAMARREA